MEFFSVARFVGSLVWRCFFCWVNLGCKQAGARMRLGSFCFDRIAVSFLLHARTVVVSVFFQ